MLRIRYLSEAEVAPATGSIAQLRHWHHSLARALAEGIPISKIAESLNRSYARVWLLSKDPLILELAEEYRAQFEAETYGIRQRIIEVNEQIHLQMSQAKSVGLGIIVDRLEDVAAGRLEMQTKDILAIVNSMADRTGHGKSTTVEVKAGDFAAALELATLRSNAVRQAPNVIELRPVGLQGSFLPPVETGPPSVTPSPVVAPSFKRRF